MRTRNAETAYFRFGIYEFVYCDITCFWTVASLPWGIGARAWSFGNYVLHSAAATSLNEKIYKITKEKPVLGLHFRLSRQKHAKTHINRLKQPRNPKETPGRGETEKFMLCRPPLISWRRLCFWTPSLSQTVTPSRTPSPRM